MLKPINRLSSLIANKIDAMQTVKSHKNIYQGSIRTVLAEAGNYIEENKCTNMVRTLNTVSKPTLRTKVESLQPTHRDKNFKNLRPLNEILTTNPQKMDVKTESISS